MPRLGEVVHSATHLQKLYFSGTPLVHPRDIHSVFTKSDARDMLSKGMF